MTAPDALGGDAILGMAGAGDLYEWSRPHDDRLWLAYPAAELARHAVVVGAAGSGKTETLLRIAYLAARVYGWQVVFLDAKGDPATRARFVAAMLAAGVAAPGIRTFPRERYDGWRGGSRALVNRLMEISDYSEPYYREMALRVLDLAVSAPPGIPRSSGDFLGRLRKTTLSVAYRRSPQAAEIQELAERDVAGVANRYRAFFGAIGRASLDGTWAFDDAPAAYLLLEGLALKAEAARLGRFFLEEFAHYAAARKDPTRRVLLIVDEFSALESTADAAHLFERLRSFAAAVIVSAQGYAGLGLAADRILDAAETLILHRCGEPERLIARAGTVSRVEHTRYLDPREDARQGSVARRDTWRVRPNDVRQLPTGHAVLISGGRAAHLQVQQVLPSPALVAGAAELLGRPPESPPPPFQPPPPPEVPGL